MLTLCFLPIGLKWICSIAIKIPPLYMYMQCCNAQTKGWSLPYAATVVLLSSPEQLVHLKWCQMVEKYPYASHQELLQYKGQIFLFCHFLKCYSGGINCYYFTITYNRHSIKVAPLLNSLTLRSLPGIPSGDGAKSKDDSHDVWLKLWLLLWIGRKLQLHPCGCHLDFLDETPVWYLCASSRDYAW